jgi:hypothetical protein
VRGWKNKRIYLRRRGNLLLTQKAKHGLLAAVAATMR